MKKTIITIGAAAFMAANASAVILINEFQPNPAGADPDPGSLELIATAGEVSFSGFFGSIESDSVANRGTVDRSGAISGSFDVNGLLVVSIADLENPSLVFFISDTDPVGLDIDADDDGVADNTGVFGSVFDAVQVIDTGSDATDYASALGGTDFAYTGDEPQTMFRDGSTQAWYAVNEPAGTDVFDSSGAAVAGTSFDTDPTGTPTTFGAVNPALVPEPSAISLLGLAGLATLLRRRR